MQICLIQIFIKAEEMVKYIPSHYVDEATAVSF